MQRVSRRFAGVSRDRGAVAVIVALLMVPLLGFAAIAVDVGALRAERQQLQTGADAGALAIAQNCGRNACGDYSATAQTLAVANANDGKAVTAVTLAGGTVTVTASSMRQHVFAPILGIDESNVVSKATAVWGTPSSGTAVIPLAFGLCEWVLQTRGGQPSLVEQTIMFTKGSDSRCTPQSNNYIAGGFGWLNATSGCRATSAVGDWLLTSTGNSLPAGCTDGDMAALQNKIALLPVFDNVSGTGTSGKYHVYGFAAFLLTGYRYPGNNGSWQADDCGSKNCIKGYFIKYVDQSNAFDISPTVPPAPDMGARSVLLTK
jgi:Flp pilus assembly protein TadG